MVVKLVKHELDSITYKYLEAEIIKLQQNHSAVNSMLLPRETSLHLGWKKKKKNKQSTKMNIHYAQNLIHTTCL